MPRLTIPTPPLFNFRATVESHGWYRLAPFEWRGDDQVLFRPETIAPGRVVDLEIRWDGALRIRRGAPSAPCTPVVDEGYRARAARPYPVSAEALSVSSAQELKSAAADLRPRLRRMFQLDVTLDEFLALCEKSPAHQEVARSRFGRLLCGSTLFEDVVKIIATTNTTWGQTIRMVRLLVNRYGEKSPGGASAFPSAAQLASADPEELQRECRMGYRARYVVEAARFLVEYGPELENRGELTTEDLFKLYLRLPGIGGYGAAHLLAMDGRHDFIAVDTEFRRFVRQKYHGGRKVADATLLKRYRRWGKWKYLAYWSELWEEVAEEVSSKTPQ